MSSEVVARAPQRIPRRTALATSRPATDRLESHAPEALRPRPSRPHLELVDTDARRRVQRRRWLVRLWAVGIVVAALSGVMVHAFMAQAQMRVDQVEQATAVEQNRYQASRLRLARLESPDALVARARAMGLIDALTTRLISVPGVGSVMRPVDPTRDWQITKPALGAR